MKAEPSISLTLLLCSSSAPYSPLSAPRPPHLQIHQPLLALQLHVPLLQLLLLSRLLLQDIFTARDLLVPEGEEGEEEEEEEEEEDGTDEEEQWRSTRGN